MANTKYTSFLQRLLNKEVNLATDVVKASLIDTADYTFDPLHDEYSADIPVAAITAVSGRLPTPTITKGVFDTGNFAWLAAAGDMSEAIVLWDETVLNGALITFYDTGMVGMPVTPNGGDINVTVNASGWFSL